MCCFMHAMDMQRPSMFIAIKFSIFEVVAVLRLFLFAWPADNLMDQVICDVYLTHWIAHRNASIDHIAQTRASTLRQ